MIQRLRKSWRELKNDAPDFRAFGGRLIQSLRYGENPHQKAAFYATPDKRPGVATARQLQGKELSYNNINDTDAAYECIGEFDAKDPDRFEHVPQLFARLECADSAHVGGVANRVFDRRPFALHKIEREAHRCEGQ